MSSIAATRARRCRPMRLYRPRRQADDASLRRQAASRCIVNLWATWCVPCIAELPELDAFAGVAAAKGVADRRGAGPGGRQAGRSLPRQAQVREFEALSRSGDGSRLRLSGQLPTTVLYDAKGKEVARVIGAPEWNGPRRRRCSRKSAADLADHRDGSLLPPLPAAARFRSPRRLPRIPCRSAISICISRRTGSTGSCRSTSTISSMNSASRRRMRCSIMRCSSATSIVSPG